MLKKSLKFVLCFSLVVNMFLPSEVFALDSGKIYKATVSGQYYHPVTNEVLDNASPDNYSIGESMVKNIVQSTGQFEVSDSGSTYFTFRLGMMNFSTNQSFQIQSYGSSSWSTVGATVTNTGSIASGTTKDFVVSAPSTSCIVKVSMYVEPMGRDVVFFVVPSGVSESDNTGMVATKVTTAVEEPVVDTTTTDSSSSSSNTTSSNTSSSNQNDDVAVTTDDDEEEVELEEIVEEEVELEEVEEEVEEIEEVVEDSSSSNTLYYIGCGVIVLGCAIGAVIYKYKKNEDVLKNEVK